jgi:hypothetical protein
MGTWGSGPFDSDGALDFLGDLTTQIGAPVDAEGNLSDSFGAIYQDRAAELLGRALEQGSACHRYAAIGLVASRLVKDNPSTSCGTSLFSTLVAGAGDGLGGQSPLSAQDSLHLGAHCGYITLIGGHHARRLVPASREALGELDRDPHTGSALREQLERLNFILEHVEIFDGSGHEA